jgi:hypothetical protein
LSRYILVGVDFHDAIRAGLFGDALHFGDVGAGAAGAAAGAAAGTAAGKAAGTAAGAAAVRPPVLGLLGIFLAQSGWSKFSNLRAGNTMVGLGDKLNSAVKAPGFNP